MKTFFKKTKNTAILEVGKTFVKIGLLQKSGKKLKMSHFLKREITRFSDIGDIFGQEDIAFDELYIILSRDLVILRNLELPSINPEEIKDIVYLQASKQTPFSRDEIISDYHVLGSTRENYTNIILGIIQRKTAQQILDNFKNRGAAIAKIVFSSEANLPWEEKIQKQIEDQTFAIVDFNDGCVDFSVVSRGQMIFGRVLQFFPSMHKQEGWQKIFLEEIVKTLKVYEKEHVGVLFNKIVFLGNEKTKQIVFDQVRTLDPQLQEFGLEEYQFRNPELLKDFNVITFEDDIDALMKSWEEEDQSFVKMVGLAQDWTQPKINFLPADVKKQRQQVHKRKEIAFTLALVFLIGLGVAGIFVEKALAKSFLLKRMDYLIANLESKTAELQKVKSRIQIINNRLEARGSAIEILRQVYQIVPEVVYLTTITFNEGKNVSLRGTTTTMTEVLNFVSTLEEISVFQNVETEYSSIRNLNETELVDFEIRCPIK